MAMRPFVTYTPYDKSSEGKNGDILTFTKFEEGNILSETCEDAESSDESDDESITSPLISKEEMDAMDSSVESDDEPISTEMLEYIRDRSRSHPNVNRREARLKIRDCMKQRQSK